MDWPYIAGYFDGEGSVRFKAAPSRPRYITTGLIWTNTHLASLVAMRSFMQAGVITTGRRVRPGVKEIYDLKIFRADEIVRVGEALLPHLLVKRDALAAMLQFVRENRKAISKHWGCLSRAGVTAISRMYHDDGKTQVAIATMFGCSRSAVATFMRRNGIPARRPGPLTTLTAPNA